MTEPRNESIFGRSKMVSMDWICWVLRELAIDASVMAGDGNLGGTGM